MIRESVKLGVPDTLKHFPKRAWSGETDGFFPQPVSVQPQRETRGTGRDTGRPHLGTGLTSGAFSTHSGPLVLWRELRLLDVTAEQKVQKDRAQRQAQ